MTAPTERFIDAIREAFLDQQRDLWDRNPPEGWDPDMGVDEPYDYAAMVNDALALDGGFVIVTRADFERVREALDG